MQTVRATSTNASRQSVTKGEDEDEDEDMSRRMLDTSSSRLSVQVYNDIYHVYTIVRYCSRVGTVQQNAPITIRRDNSRDRIHAHDTRLVF